MTGGLSTVCAGLLINMKLGSSGHYILSNVDDGRITLLGLCWGMPKLRNSNTNNYRCIKFDGHRGSRVPLDNVS